MNLELPKCDVNTNVCDGISNFEPGMALGQNSWVFIVIGTVTPSVKMAGAVRKIVCKSRFQISRIVRKFWKCHFLKVALCVLCYGESVGVEFIFLEIKLTKLLAIKAKQVDDLKTYLEQLFKK